MNVIVKNGRTPDGMTSRSGITDAIVTYSRRMKCRECGTEIAEKALICFRCGASVEEAVTKPYVPPRTRRPLVVYVVFVLLVLIAMMLMLMR